MKTKVLFLLLTALFINTSLFAQKFTISGNIKDAKNGEELIGANLFVEETKSGAITNIYGFYSLTLPAGDYTLIYSFLGYNVITKKINLNTNQTINIELAPESQEIDEVVITGDRADKNIKRVQMSTEKLQMRAVKKIPALMGEVDVMKTIQMLPGVQTAGEGTSGIYVRGGGVDQNLILLDGATVYNASHLGGLFSVFNQDAIKNVELYKGGIPAQYGGRLSSLLDVRQKDGNSKHLAVSGGIGLISSRLCVETPIIKDKASIILAGRRSYADLFFPLFENTKDSKIYFYDFNGKFNYKINDKNRIYVSTYLGDDISQFSEFLKMSYGNQTFSLRYNHLFSDKLFSNFTLLYSKFDYNLEFSNNDENFDWHSNIIDYSAKVDFSYFANPQNTIKFGYDFIHHTFKPGYSEKYKEGDGFFNNLTLPNKYAYEHGLFLSNEQKIGGLITLSYGLRLSVFQNVGKGEYFTYQKISDEEYIPVDSTNYKSGEVFKTHMNLEPRFGIRVQLDESTSLKGSYNRTAQYLHLATNTTSTTPLDMWMPSSKNIKPSTADQVALGIFKNFKDNTIETSMEVYYKKMYDVIDFRDHADLFINKHLEGEIRSGDAYSYGLEMMIKKTTGRFTGWLSYTLSKTMRDIPEINKGKEYNAPYDKTHNFSLILSYDISKRVNISTNWVYNTGAARTMPSGGFEYGNMYAPIYSERNGTRLPDYHRMDLSCTLYGKTKRKDGTPKKLQSNWIFSIYNLYGRHNAYSVNFGQNEDNPQIREATKTYMFDIFPSVTWNFKF